MSWNSGLLAVVVLLLPALTWGQNLPSGPERGKAVPALKVFDVTGQQEGKEYDYVADRKDRPTIYLFIHAEKWDRPMARFVRMLDDAVKRDGGDAYIVAVWVQADPEKAKEYLPLAQKSLQLKATALTVYTGDKAGPPEWHINSDVHLTVLVAAQGKVASAFGYRSINETDVPAVSDALKRAREAK